MDYMRKIFHICLSSHEEVMFRTEADFVRGFNCLAETALLTESRLLADGLLSTHWHTVVQTDDPDNFVRRYRYSYARYFNSTHSRQGRLGERKAFVTEIDGIHRLTTAISYVNRQGLHHGLTATPFGYPHCSVNAYYRRELGKDSMDCALMPAGCRHQFLTRNVRIPESYRMAKNGLLLREDILDTSYVEQVYLTPRNFLFQMNKLTDERIMEEQKSEKSSTPVISIDLIEQGTPDFNIKQMLVNEQGRVNKSWMTDQDLCRLIDSYYIPRLKGEGSPATVYSLSPIERSRLFETMKRDLRQARFSDKNDGRTLVGSAGLAGQFVTEPQLRRCLVV